MYEGLSLLKMYNVYNDVAEKYPEPDFDLSFIQSKVTIVYSCAVKFISILDKRYLTQLFLFVIL